MLWLELPNAYGFIPHKLVEMALEWQHIPINIKELIMDYYDNFKLGFTSGPVIPEWHQLEKGIITGCTISVTLLASYPRTCGHCWCMNSYCPLSRGLREV